MKKVAIGGVALVGVIALSSCAKFTEPFKDAHVSTRDNAPAEVGTMPDGFSNWAAKCVPGSHTLVITTSHGSANRTAVAAVVDPHKCP